MFNWTIDGREYHAPMGYGEITIAEFTAFRATVTPPKVKPKPKITSGNSWRARLARRIRKKTQELRPDREQESFDWLERMEYEAAFVQHWLKLPIELMERMEPNQVRQFHDFLVKEWSAWKPIPKIGAFAFDKKSWMIDYSIATLGSIDKTDDLQTIMSKVCVSNGKRMKPRAWGGLSLHIAASIMLEISERHKVIGTIIGASILDAFNIER